MNQYRDISTHTKLIAALAETMSNADWATEILAKCDMIEKALEEIRRIAEARRAGER